MFGKACFSLLCALFMFGTHVDCQFTNNRINPKKGLATEARIVNGTVVDISRHPYQASLQQYDRHICGAVIIHPKFLLTAAHCIEIEDPEEYSVIVATNYHTRGRRYKVGALRVHEKYNNLDNDIALLKIEGELEFNTRVQPIPLNRALELPNTMAVVTGWGYDRDDGDLSDKLMRLIVPVVNPLKCRRLYRDVLTITTKMLCAGYIEGFRDACQGDSGGPLVANGKLIGIVSSGSGCAEPGFPGVYTNVAKFIKWISYTMQNL